MSFTADEEIAALYQSALLQLHIAGEMFRLMGKHEINARIITARLELLRGYEILQDLKRHTIPGGCIGKAIS